MVSFDIKNIVSALLLISIVLIVSILTFILIVAGGNDYALGVMYDVTEILEEKGYINDSRVLAQADDLNQTALIMLGYVDDIWLFVYIMFSISLFLASYYASRMDFFTFNNIMYIGIMVFMFLLDYIAIATEWIQVQVLYNILPTASSLIPKFIFFIDHIGIIISSQIVICIVLNILDFNFIQEKIRKDKEQKALQSNEVV